MGSAFVRRLAFLCAVFALAMPTYGAACYLAGGFRFEDILEADLIVEGYFLEVDPNGLQPGIYTFHRRSVIHGHLDPAASDSLRESQVMCLDNSDCTPGTRLRTSNEMTFAWAVRGGPDSVDELGYDQIGRPESYIVALRHPASERFFQVLDGERVFFGPSREYYSVLHEPCEEPHVFLARSPYGVAVRMIFEESGDRLERLQLLDRFVRRSSTYCERGNFLTSASCD